MPRMYIAAADFALYPAALAFPFQVAQLTAVGSGALDRMLARASRRVDGYCKKRIGAPGNTTVGTGGIAAGATVLPVASTLGFDGGQEEALILGTGGTQEILPVVPGGIAVTSWVAPYPGTITLASPAAYSHLAGESVAGCYQEVSTVGSSGSSDAYSDELIMLSQEAQIAAAHAPFATVDLTRVIFLKQYPILSLYAMEYMLPIDTVYQSLAVSNVGISPASGYLRLPLGSFVLPNGLIKTTYSAGFQFVPDEVQQATAWYAADELQTIISHGAVQMQQVKQRGVYATKKDGVSLFEQRAQNLLDRANLKRRT